MSTSTIPLIFRRWQSTVKPTRSRPPKPKKPIIPSKKRDRLSSTNTRNRTARPLFSEIEFDSTTSSSAPSEPESRKKVLSETRFKTVNLSLPRPPLPKVLYEDKNLVVIDKPSGAGLQAQYGTEARLSWEAILRGIQTKIGTEELNPVHRLDKATTGTLILSKSSTSHKNLCSQLSRHEISRKYLAIVHGRLKPGYKDVINAPLRVDTDRVRLNSETESTLGMDFNSASDAGEMKGLQIPFEDRGKVVEAGTEWECLASSPSNLSLLLLSPRTGRKHQLRVHSSQVLRAPILGDHKYALDPHLMTINDLPSTFTSKSGMFLHAWSLRLHVWDKTSGKRKTIGATAPLPYTFKRVFKKLGWEAPKVDDISWPDGLSELYKEKEDPHEEEVM